LRIRSAVEQIEEEHHMPYTTSIERMAREEGRVERRLEAEREAIRRVVRAHFGAVPQVLEERLASADSSALNMLIERAATVATPDDL
jgi:hypothetical protein